MKHYFLLIGFLLGIFSAQAAFATQIAGLYQAGVDSATSGNEWQRQALAQVLVRVSGKAEVTELPQVKAELAKAASYVKQFENVRQAGGNRMRVLLDADKVNQLLQQQGVPVWGALRPDTLIWLVEQNGAERQFVRQSSHQLNVAMQQAFRQAALPLMLPLYDMDDLLNLAETDVWAGFWQPVVAASSRYGADVVIIGTVERQTVDGTEQLRLNWQRQEDGRTLREEITAADEATLMQQFTRVLAAQLSERYASVLSGENVGQFVLQVQQLSDLADIVQVQRLLQQVVGVSQVTVSSYHAGVARFTVQAGISADGLLNALRFNKQLQPQSAGDAIATDEPAQPTLATYRYLRP
ncbi:hypothetical protein M2404_001932 [Rheinheimera pacifica]|uniref:DUF2066 domain-containing protein n=1 Tax=Rheinheimera pacifica TaxID=173990 RepID=UPI002168904F|nr:DUF2066 domain-containing protein [Rheinheimera pacifica]MCS4307598.1 hypothetical protein [Rheinheimera pacifica]